MVLGMEWSIQQLARLAGTTSRTLRHYDQLGLVSPSRMGSNGYRYYGEAELLRLQQVLLYRSLGLELKKIADLLARETDVIAALQAHRETLTREQELLRRRIAAVDHTIGSLIRKDSPMPERMFDGFDHREFREEVEERWGKAAYARSTAWWEGLGKDGQRDWQQRLAQLNQDWQAAAASGVSADSAVAQAMAQRHVDWLQAIPTSPRDGFRDYLAGLAEMYVADSRFAANYGGQAGAEFVRAALLAWLTAN